MKSLLVAALVPVAIAASGPGDWSSKPQGQRIIPRLDQSPPIDGGKRSEVLYGPYTIPANKMITKGQLIAKAPCSNCYVTAMQATIKYPNGKEALTSEGAWLHHTVLASMTKGAIWAAGNERPTIRLNAASKYGIDWPASYGVTVDIMSERPEPMNVSMSIIFEYIDKNSDMGKKYKDIVMRWLTIGYPAPPTGKKSYPTQPWKADMNAKLLYAIGHMHDGGTNMDLRINNKVVCDSQMFYGKREGYSAATAAAMKGHSHARRSPQMSSGGEASFGGLHISDPGACTDFATVARGDNVTSRAYYDMDKHATMVHSGKAERIMGNMRVYMGPM